MRNSSRSTNSTNSAANAQCFGENEVVELFEIPSNYSSPFASASTLDVSNNSSARIHTVKNETTGTVPLNVDSRNAWQSRNTPTWRKSKAYSSASSSSTVTPTNSERGRTFNEYFLHLLDEFFYNIGESIADNAIIILSIVFVITVICSSKILFTSQEDDIRTGYTPNGAQSHVETRLYEQFYRNITSTLNATESAAKPSTGSGLLAKENSDINEPISVVVFIEARDGGSMLRDDHLNDTVELIDDISTRFQIVGKNFYEFCTDFCYLNEPIRQFKNGMLVLNSISTVTNFMLPAELDTKSHDSNITLMNNDAVNGDLSDDSDNRIRLSFPFASMFSVRLDMSPHFFGVETYSPTEMRQRAAAGQRNFGLNIRFMRLIILQLRAERPAGATREDVANWERALAKYLHTERDSLYTRAYVLSVTVVGDEIVRTGMTLFPYITVGFVFMSIFSIATVYLSAFYYNQWTVQKAILALWACICPLLATSTALGFMFWFGFRFGTILAVSPFLIMAIGVDDAYLMIHAYQRYCAEWRQEKDDGYCTMSEQPNRDAAIRRRISNVLVDVGPSITITSLTNVLAFGVGIFSPTPEIQLFCAGNAMAVFVDYVYQLFMFTPIIALAARVECRDKVRSPSDCPPPQKLFVVGAAIVDKRPTNAMFAYRQRLEKILTRFMACYCRWLASGFTTTMVILILVAYWIGSLHGALNIDVNITPKKLFLADSFINEINSLRDAYILPNYTAISVFVNRAGNLDDSERLARLRSLVADFEAMPNCLGSEFTHFWLRDYDKYMDTMRETEEENVETTIRFRPEELRTFLSWTEYRHWRGFMRFASDDDLRIEKFFVVIAYHGSDLVAWRRRSELLGEWRQIANNYSDLEAWVWADDAQFLDQIDTLVPATIQSSLATLLCMMLVCALFMSNLFTVVIATLSIISICIGVFGCLAFWSIDLDPISMATTIMSIGFSVDFPAHVTYHYYRSGLDSELDLRPEDRIYQSLISISFPLLQCGLSTILFVLCLLFVDTYMSEVFVKTMVLVVSLGLLHGLFVVPTFLCALSKAYMALCSARKQFQRLIRDRIIGPVAEKNSKTPSLRDLVHATKPALKIRRRLSKKNIARIVVADLAA